MSDTVYRCLKQTNPLPSWNYILMRGGNKLSKIRKPMAFLEGSK
jgi:hypothetical protein